MAISSLDLDHFKSTLHEHLSPSKAITNASQLRGRAQKLGQIEKAFNSPGRQIFIFGDRGVGKTSLAQTAAHLHQSSDNTPITVGCDSTSTFYAVIRDIVTRCIGDASLTKKRVQETFKLGSSFLGYDLQKVVETGSAPELRSLNEAVSILKVASKIHSRSPVIVIDEFDQLSRPEDKKLFADFIKQVSDQDVGIKLIFCGIGSSLDDILGLHLSTTRYLSAIELERLSHDARWEILAGAAEALGVSVDRETNIRIGTISDGFPYYIHLVGEKLFWRMWEDANVLSECAIHHFEEAIKDAVVDISPFLKRAYQKATQKYGNDYQEVLWAVADHPMLQRSTTEIYESYGQIMKQLGRCPMEKSRFYAHMGRLKSERHGFILKATRTGWYGFSENIVRGYVRLIAEEAGVQLEADHLLAAKRRHT